MPDLHARALRRQSAFQIDRDASRDSSPHDRMAEGFVAPHLFGHRHHGQAERLRPARDRARIVLDRVEVDDIGVRRQLAALMQGNGGLDQSRIAPADQVEKHGVLPQGLLD